jgi:ribonucleases P/MRP protein subunit RPP40
MQRVVLGEGISSWTPVTSGVPQGSVLGPLLFVLYINDLPNRLTGDCKLYADDTKLISRVESQNACEGLQSDLDAVQKWTTDWKLPLNLDKCKVMHIGKKNLIYSYHMRDYSTGKKIIIGKTDVERDLGVLLRKDLKAVDQVNKSASTSARILAMLANTFRHRRIGLWSKLYKTYVRPHLEFAISSWCPYRKKDINALEKVQRRATRIPKQNLGLEYDARCKKMGLTCLSDRRVRGDLINIFKIRNGIDEVTWHYTPLTRQPTGRRAGELKRELVSSAVRYNFFNNRIVNAWNGLPKEIVEANSVNSFKNKLDLFYAIELPQH